MKPSRYFVEYVKRWVEDEAPETELVDCNTLAEARAIYAQHLDDLPQILERTDIRDVTPADDPPGLLWDFEEQLIEDSPFGAGS